MQLVDAYFYRDRLTMPKLAVNAGGDEFQMPDDHRYWAHDMPGEMNLLMVRMLSTPWRLASSKCCRVLVRLLQLSCTTTLARIHLVHRRLTGAITVVNVKPKLVTVASSFWGGCQPAVVTSVGRHNTSFCIVKVFGACVRRCCGTPQMP